MQGVAHKLVETLVVDDQRDLVEAAGVRAVDDTTERHVGESGDLAFQLVADRLVAPTDDGVGLDAGAAEFGHRVLRGLRLVFARRADERHQGHVDVADVGWAYIETELSDGLEEGKDLDVANRASDLSDEDVDVVAGQPSDPTLDLIGDVGDDLDGPAQVLAVAFGGDHRGIDRPGGRVGVPGQVLVDEPFVVTEVQVGLTTVIGDEDLPMFKGVHRSRIHVDVWIELLDDNPKTALLEEASEGGGSQALTERTRHPSRHEDVFRHGSSTYPRPATSARSAPWDPGSPVTPVPWTRQRPRAAWRSSVAWPRAVSLSGEPESIRESSTTRSSASSGLTEAAVLWPSSTLATSI